MTNAELTAENNPAFGNGSEKLREQAIEDVQK